MIGLSRAVSVHVYTEPVDMRKQFDTLAAMVAQKLKQNLLSGALFVFVSRNRKRTKVLYFDGTGLCLYCKRLERGYFMAPWKRPKLSSNTWEMTLSELSLFVEGSEAVGQMALSPPLLTRADLRIQKSTSASTNE